MVADLSGQHICPIFKGQAVQEEHVCTELYPLRKAQKTKTFLRYGSNGDPMQTNRMVKTLPTTNIDSLRLTQPSHHLLTVWTVGDRGGGGGLKNITAPGKNVDGAVDDTVAGRAVESESEGIFRWSRSR
jgi:hypothetical protein